MVCINEEISINIDSETDLTMDCGARGQMLGENEWPPDKSASTWKLRHLAGSDLTQQRPLFSADGEYLFVTNDKIIQVYNAITGILSHKLTGAMNKLVSTEIDLLENKTLVSCTEKGELIRWKWKNGKIENTITLDIPKSMTVRSFNLLNYFDEAGEPCGIITYQQETSQLQWSIMNTINGKTVEVNCRLKLQCDRPLVAVNNEAFKTIAICQREYIYFIDYKSWRYNRLFNALRVPITAVSAHSTEELFATGDERGKVFLWRHFMDKSTIKCALYHWHHTAITSVAFSASGSHFLSSGHESTLVKWDVTHPNIRSFLPRFPAVITHVSVSKENAKVAVCTADNSIQIIGSDNKIQIVLQEFTYIADSKTQESKFPVGLRFNPRMATIVLNGRTGHLQFYSTYTKNLLFNMDVVRENIVSIEEKKILYNTNVTNAAFSMDWMATGEVFNDMQHLPEVRLKFWKFEEESHSYSLNTNVELAHEGGIKDIQFSTWHSNDNLLCATIGEDNVIKIWGLDDSDNIYKYGKVWYCIAETQYNNENIGSISFSDDGSVLCAGFENSLCVYIAKNLNLKCCLSPCVDSCSNPPKIEINLPSSHKNFENKSEELNTFLTTICKGENDVSAEFKNIITRDPSRVGTNSLSPNEISFIQNELFKHKNLTFTRKILGVAKLKGLNEMEVRLSRNTINHLIKKLLRTNFNARLQCLEKNFSHQSPKHFFRAKYRMKKLKSKMDLMREGQKADAILKLIYEKLNDTEMKLNKNIQHPKEENKKLELNNLETSCINHIQCLSGDCSNMVLVCIPYNVLIWNLMTLRYKVVLHENVLHMAHDHLTNLVALFTDCNKLLIYDADKLIILYEHTNLPSIYAGIWVPRRNPTLCNLSSNWQAKSILYFLTENQEIYYMASEKDILEEQERTPAVFSDLHALDQHNFTAFGAFAAKQITDPNKQEATINEFAVHLDRGRTAVQSLLEMSIHTMAPLSLLCNDFTQLMLVSETSLEDEKNKSDVTSESIVMNGHDYKEEMEDSDEEIPVENNTNKESLTIRKIVNNQIEDFDESMDFQIDKKLEQEIKALASTYIHLDL